jgi:Uma2 family endonuclease
MVTTKPMTAEEFMALPDDGWRYELIRGELHRMSPGGVQHGGIGAKFARRLGVYVEDRDLGLVLVDTGFVFEDDPPTLRVPDVAFIRAERLPPPDELPLFSRVAPDLAIEVVSPNDAPAEIAEKVAFDLAHGVPLVWVAYPRPRQVSVHRPGQEPHTLGVGDTLEGEDVVPGFRLALADLFR